MNQRRQWRAAAIGLLTCGMAAGGLACASDKSTIAKASAANDQLAPAVITDADLQAYFQQVGDRVIAAAKSYDAAGQGPDTHTTHKTGENQWMFSDGMKFHLVNSKTVNAFTTGGQHMYVYTALFQLCDKETDLSAVMSHEFAHVYSRHVQKGTDRSTGMAVAVYGAAGLGYLYGGQANGSSYADTAQKGASSALQYAGMSFTRKDEAQADEWGFKFYAKSGWDADHFGDFFQKMIDLGYDTTPASQSDHPTLKSRVEVSKKYAAAWDAQHPNGAGQVPPVADAGRFAALKAKAAQISAASPDDTQVKKAQTLLASFNSCFGQGDQPEQKAAKAELGKP